MGVFWEYNPRLFLPFSAAGNQDDNVFSHFSPEK